MSQCDYRGLGGSLNYFSQSSRPEIANAARSFCSFQEKPGEEHWIAAERVLRYLKGTKGQYLSYKISEKEMTLIGFSDADWASNVDHRKSVCGFCLILNES